MQLDRVHQWSPGSQQGYFYICNELILLKKNISWTKTEIFFIPDTQQRYFYICSELILLKNIFLAPKLKCSFHDFLIRWIGTTLNTRVIYQCLRNALNQKKQNFTVGLTPRKLF